MTSAYKHFRGWIVLVSLFHLTVNSATHGQSYAPGPRAPIARLIKTPDDSGNLPPYALADQTGTIQRYVEPVPGIDLDSYVNQIVTVRHDTGQTLLASQLELPRTSSLLPMVGESYETRIASAAGDSAVRQAEFVDNDDSTVELVNDGDTLPGPPVQGNVMQGAIYPDGSPAYPDGTMMDGGPMYADPTGYAPMGAYPQSGPFVGPTPQPMMGFVQPAQQVPERPHVYADVDINFLRTHVKDGPFGKLSEKYEFSPRIVVGFTDVAGVSGRVRYWIYSHGTDGLADDDGVHMHFNVLDVEATHLIEGRRSQLELAAGFRLADIEIKDEPDDAKFGTDLVGLTMAADGWTPVCKCAGGCFGWAYGGRLSILGGDWDGDDDSLILNHRIQDDNALVHELYAGIGFTRRCGRFDFNACLDFEMQNWHSDVLAEIANDTSLGIIGPGLRIGAEF